MNNKPFRMMFCSLWALIFTGISFSKTPPASMEMNEIFTGLAVILPLSLDTEEFSGKKNAAKIIRNLDRMQQVAEELSRKARGTGYDFHFVANNLSEDLRLASGHYRKGNFRRSAFIVQNMTENCFVCHSRYRKNNRTPDAGHFLADIDLDKMNHRDAARLKVVTRQFRPAVASYEKAIWQFRRSLPGAPLEEYLSVTLSVLKEPDIPVKLFGKLSRLKDPGFSHKFLVDGWKKDLEDLKNSVAWKAVSLKNLHALLKKAREKTDFMYDRRGLVYWVAAKGYLNQLSLEKHPAPVQAELYYWLGVVATMFEGSYWVVQMPEYLERSVRADPGGPFAVRAMTLLENNIAEGYTGSAGSYIPLEEQKKLEELKALVKHSQPSRSAKKADGPGKAFEGSG